MTQRKRKAGAFYEHVNLDVNLITCPVCRDIYKEPPIILGCTEGVVHHSVCATCWPQITSRKCPLCCKHVVATHTDPVMNHILETFAYPMPCGATELGYMRIPIHKESCLACMSIDRRSVFENNECMKAYNTRRLKCLFKYRWNNILVYNRIGKQMREQGRQWPPVYPASPPTGNAFDDHYRELMEKFFTQYGDQFKLHSKTSSTIPAPDTNDVVHTCHAPYKTKTKTTRSPPRQEILETSATSIESQCGGGGDAASAASHTKQCIHCLRIEMDRLKKNCAIIHMHCQSIERLIKQETDEFYALAQQLRDTPPSVGEAMAS